MFKDSNDIDPQLKGYVSIAYGLEIVQCNNDYIYHKCDLQLFVQGKLTLFTKNNMLPKREYFLIA